MKKNFDLVVCFEKKKILIHGKNRIFAGHRKLSKIFYRHFFKF